MFERLSFLRRIQLAVAITAVIFVLVLGALALRTALGKDPALGSSQAPSAQTTSADASAASAPPASEEPYDSDYDEGYGEDDDGSWGASAQDSSGGWGQGAAAPDSSAAAQAPMTTAQS